MAYPMMKKMDILRNTILALMLLMAIPSLQAEQSIPDVAAEGSAWKFRVYLDDKEIGYHHFFLAEYGETRQLKSVASFEYKLMFVRLFHYEHENSEIWVGDCLQSINSRTDANGKVFQVDGHREAGEFRIAANEGQESLPECVMSFAYWNPTFLDQSTLINTQSGEFQQVIFSPPEFEELVVRGEVFPSWRYRLTAGNLNLNLWYSANREWLALESEVKGGRMLRYELEDPGLPQISNDRTNASTLNVLDATPAQRGL